MRRRERGSVRPLRHLPCSLVRCMDVRRYIIRKIVLISGRDSPGAACTIRGRPRRFSVS
jgi:hypothetical protein